MLACLLHFLYAATDTETQRQKPRRMRTRCCCSSYLTNSFFTCPLLYFTMFKPFSKAGFSTPVSE